MAKLSVTHFEDPDQARDKYLREVDMVTEQAITNYTGSQSMVYEAKYKEAVRYPTEGNFPWLTEEARLLGVPLETVVHSVLSAREKWERTYIANEALRVNTKRRIREASAVLVMHQAVTELKNQLASIT